MEVIKEQKKKGMVYEANLFLLFQIINVADFKAPKCNACEDVSVGEPRTLIISQAFLVWSFLHIP